MTNSKALLERLAKQAERSAAIASKPSPAPRNPWDGIIRYHRLSK